MKLNVATVDTQPVHGKDVLYIDSDNSWSRINQLEAGGAIIVRPDNIVAWRSIGPAIHVGCRLHYHPKETENSTRERWN